MLDALRCQRGMPVFRMACHVDAPVDTLERQVTAHLPEPNNTKLHTFTDYNIIIFL